MNLLKYKNNQDEMITAKNESFRSEHVIMMICSSVHVALLSMSSRDMLSTSFKCCSVL